MNKPIRLDKKCQCYTEVLYSFENCHISLIELHKVQIVWHFRQIHGVYRVL